MGLTPQFVIVEDNQISKLDNLDFGSKLKMPIQIPVLIEPLYSFMKINLTFKGWKWFSWQNHIWIPRNSLKAT